MSRKKWGSYSPIEKALIVGIPIGFLVIAALFGLSLFGIFSSVKSICTGAQQEFEGDCVEALMSLVESDKFSYRKRNKAIWALGQIGDPRAIPLLEKLDTGEVQEKPYDPSRGDRPVHGEEGPQTVQRRILINPMDVRLAMKVRVHLDIELKYFA